MVLLACGNVHKETESYLSLQLFFFYYGRKKANLNVHIFGNDLI